MGMKRLSLAWIVLGGLGCASTPLPAELSTANVEILELRPEPGTAVDGDEKIEAKVRYSIDPFHGRRGLYYLTIQFDGATPGRIVGRTSTDKGSSKDVSKASGTAWIRYPLWLLWYPSDLDVAQPIVARVILNQKTGPRSSRSIGQSERFSYPTTDE